jgi:protein-disulfide isomerase
MPFSEPWEAEVQALAMLVLDWQDVSGKTDYLELLEALERAVVERGMTSADELATLRAAWDRAAHRTPHGTPIELTDADFTSGG